MDEFEELDGEFPDIHSLFLHYNDLYFNGVLLGNTTVEWSSKRMTLCGGICRYHPLSGCQIKLSEPLLKLRPVRDLKMVLLHEMIHAHNMTLRIRDPDPGGHGQPFLELMNKINRSTVPDPQRPAGGYKITTTHSMHGEVDNYRTHWWECERCKKVIKRAMNRPPQEADCIGRTGSRGAACHDPNCGYHTHLRTCGGAYIKIREPDSKPKPNPDSKPKPNPDSKPKPKASRKTSPVNTQQSLQHQPSHKPGVLPGQQRIDDIVRSAKRRAQGLPEPAVEPGTAKQGAVTVPGGSSIGGGGVGRGREHLHVQTGPLAGPLPGLWQMQRVPAPPRHQARQDPKPSGSCESVPAPVRQGDGDDTAFGSRAAGGIENSRQQGVLDSPSAGDSASPPQPHLPTAATHSKQPWPAIPTRRRPEPAWGFGAMASGPDLNGPSATTVEAEAPAGACQRVGTGADRGRAWGAGPERSAMGSGEGIKSGSGRSGGPGPRVLGPADGGEVVVGKLESGQLGSGSGSGSGWPMSGGSRMVTGSGQVDTGVGGAEAPSAEELRQRCAEAALARLLRYNGKLQPQPPPPPHHHHHHHQQQQQHQQQQPRQQQQFQLHVKHGRDTEVGDQGLRPAQVIHAILDSDEDRAEEAKEGKKEKEEMALETVDARSGAEGRMPWRDETGRKVEAEMARRLRDSVPHVASRAWVQGLTRPPTVVGAERGTQRRDTTTIPVEVIDLVDDDSDKG